MNKSGLDYLRYRLEIAKECEADSVKIDIEELASALGEVDRIKNEVIGDLQKDTSITLRALATELMKNQKNYSEDTCHYFSKGIQAFVIHIEKFIAEQIKERD